MAIDWAGYAKVGVNIAPKVFDGLKRLGKSRDPLVVLTDWSGTQQRVWQSGVIHGVKQYELGIDLRARFENGSEVPRVIKAATVTLRRRRFGRLVKIAEAPIAGFSLLTAARIIQSFDDRKHNTIRVEAHSLTDSYYFMCHVPLPKGLVSLDRDYVATVRFHTVGSRTVSVRLPIRCPDPHVYMGFTQAPDA